MMEILLYDDSLFFKGLDALLCCSDQEAKGRIQSKWNHAFIMTLYHRYYSICLLSYIIYIDEFSISALHMFQGTALPFSEEAYILLEYHPRISWNSASFWTSSTFQRVSQNLPVRPGISIDEVEPQLCLRHDLHALWATNIAIHSEDEIY